MTHIRANFAGATPLEGPLVAGLVAGGILPGRPDTDAAEDWVQALVGKDTARRLFGATGGQGNDAALTDTPPEANVGDDRLPDAGADATHFVTRRANAVRLLTLHAGPYPWQPLLALALGIAFASLAIGLAADLGATAAARPHYTSVEALPT